MPCRYDPSPDEIRASERARIENSSEFKRMQTDLDRLTHENDQLREIVLALAEKDPKLKVPKFIKDKIKRKQIEHRKEDLARLKDTFTASKDAEKLGLVMLADPNKPLEPQLGFDPDDF